MNLRAALLAAVSSFLPGGLGYSPALFGRVWTAENGGPSPLLGTALEAGATAGFWH
jgi:hypothetical protein